MSNNIKTILEAMNADPAIIALVNGVRIPLIGDRYKLHTNFFYSFPPAFVPVFEDNGQPSLLGILRHWFVQRDTVYVNYLLEVHMFEEVGRNAQQVIADMILRMDMLEEGLTEEITTFAKEVGFEDTQAIDDFAEQYGDIYSEFHHLPVFGEDIPLSFAPDLKSYKGDYPASEEILNARQLSKACSFEVPYKWATEPGWPEWMMPGADKKKLFERYLENKELDKAWLTLNSRGWIISDAIVALSRLKAEEKDPLFHLIADNWIKGWQEANRTHLNY